MWWDGNRCGGGSWCNKYPDAKSPPTALLYISREKFQNILYDLLIYELK